MIKEETFTPTQMACLQALVDTLIPPDDYPGGWDAGVGDYLARQFDGDLRDAVPAYQSGLTSLNAEAGDGGFAALDLDARTQLLKRLERGEASTTWTLPPSAPPPEGSHSAGQFIAMAATHAAEGFYSDPGNGGNRDGVAWEMIGFEVTG